MMRYFLRFPRMRALSALVTVALLAPCTGAHAGFLDDSTAFGSAMAALRSATGEHPRVLRIEVDANRVTIEAQDPRNRRHVDRWQYGVVNVLGVLPIKRLTKVEWLDAATIAAAIARIAPTFGREAKIASIAFDNGRGSFAVDESDNDNRPATFGFSSDGVTREASSR